MMRPLIFLAVIILGAAQTPSPSPPSEATAMITGGATVPAHSWCAINSLLISDELMNSIIFIWQGVLRCGNGKASPNVECSVEVSYAIQAVNNMINTVLKTVDDCTGALQGKAQCGMAVGQVTSAMAGVAATASSIAEHCPKTSMQPVPGLQQAAVGNPPFSHALAHCIVDAKSLIYSIIMMSTLIADASQDCKVKGEACTVSILMVVASVARMGEFIAGVVGHCSKPPNQAGACAGGVLGLLRNLGDLATAGKTMGVVCALTMGERLYLEESRRGKQIQTEATIKDKLPMFALAMLLPITAALSFVAGRRMAKYHQIDVEEEIE